MPLFALLPFDPYLIFRSVKQRGIKYHFLSLWYDSTWDWRLVCWTTAEYCNHYIYIYIYICIYIFVYIYIYIYTCIYIITIIIISKQWDIKLGPFTRDKLDSLLRKIKNGKAVGLDETTPEIWKSRQCDDILHWHCNAVYNQNPIDRWMKGYILPFPKKGDLGLAKNYRGITLTSIVAKIYNALLRNRIEPTIENILRKNQSGFRRNRPMT